VAINSVAYNGSTTYTAMSNVTLTGNSLIAPFFPQSTAWGARTQTILIQGSTDGTTYRTLVPAQGYTFDPNTGNTAWPAGQLSELQAFAS
jgi:hypothetical protein